MLAHTTPTRMRLAQGHGALSTLASRIDAAFGFGLLSAQNHREPHKLRQIRSNFAHSVEALSFDDPPISDLCDSRILGMLMRSRCSTPWLRRTHPVDVVGPLSE